MNADISLEFLKSVLSYDSQTGLFTWVANRGNNPKSGKVAGSLTSRGYVNIVLNDKKYKAHRLAWFYSHEEWPLEDVDHINRVRSDNRIDNLRLASRLQNIWNSPARSNNSAGLKGVYWDEARQKWASQIRLNGRNRRIGRFNSAEEAYSAYLSAAEKHHGSFFCEGLIMQPAHTEQEKSDE